MQVLFEEEKERIDITSDAVKIEGQNPTDPGSVKKIPQQGYQTTLWSHTHNHDHQRHQGKETNLFDQIHRSRNHGRLDSLVFFCKSMQDSQLAFWHRDNAASLQRKNACVIWLRFACNDLARIWLSQQAAQGCAYVHKDVKRNRSSDPGVWLISEGKWYTPSGAISVAPLPCAGRWTISRSFASEDC